jgi:manganese/zinc/iron transport system substrate-binding protein
MRIFYASFIFLLTAAACAPSSAAPDATSLRVVATTGMIGDTARQIGGDACEVTALMGPGVDPHLYRPAQRDLRSLTGADLILYNGLKLEGRMADVLARMDGRTRTAVVTDGIPRERLLASLEYPDQFDPHVWMDVGLWRLAAEHIHQALTAADPGNAAKYDANAAAHLAELDALDAEIREILEAVPESKRVLITAHDAFGYFGEAYGFEVLGLQGISTDAEFGLQDIERLIDIVVERDVAAIFLETSVSRRSLEALATGARARGQALRLGGPLYSDALGEAGTPEGSYIGMMRHNARTIAEALL